MNRRFRELILVLTAAVWPIAISAGEEAASTQVSGTVIYKPDASKPWRYSRYFVKDTRSGELAEAVVALRGSTLKDWVGKTQPKIVEMDQLNFQFTPQTLAIRVGDAVRFLNSDATTHNVRATGRLANFSENISPDFDFEYRFERPGGIAQPVQIGCAFHGGMQAWVLVFDHPFFAVTKPDGKYEFKNVPAGKYRLDVYHPAGNLRRSRTIEIKRGGVVTEFVELSPANRLK